ncbi:hypothetical protein DFA_07374 [Cavenderia fasciculata]|uniref:Uncharacterized protein n=1 Tax=Cavenderia fasciculata TaxID=261658 RepID=F4PW87_CACFS|nr:uncharacterized protein DFA_07374 [Cavenderia fasciculata]EGG20251.1 hypothetical protein DFA_07374 [Cavenderia fasciculata]|eukprot:XP_004367234.1 hypothetical protein DFA_07374 [Cavenderia fasciculata]
MKIILSVLLVIFALFVASSLAIDCAKLDSPLTCAAYEPPCFWNGKKCLQIHRKLQHCQKMVDVDSCQSEKGNGCAWEAASSSCTLAKFHCSSIKNEFDCTIENCVWSYKKNSCSA